MREVWHSVCLFDALTKKYESSWLFSQFPLFSFSSFAVLSVDSLFGQKPVAKKFIAAWRQKCLARWIATMDFSK